MLRELPLKAVYRSDEDNILEDFYVPALSQACAYDRAVGFFSASMLSYAGQGLSAFVRNDGRMRLIVGAELHPDDFDAVMDGYEQRRALELLERRGRPGDLGHAFVAEIDRVDDPLLHCRLELLAFLVASGRLDIKVALKQRGMYHEKIGILRDANGDQVIFQGSANESTYALLPDFNFESINVFQSWKTELQDHFMPYLTGFEKLWDNRTRGTLVISFPDAARDRLIGIARQAQIPTPSIEAELWKRATESYRTEDLETSNPTVPKVLGTEPFELRKHQRDALQSWSANDFQPYPILLWGRDGS